METGNSKLWLFNSLSTNLSKKKKLKVEYPNGDFNAAFQTLCSTVLKKCLKCSEEDEVSKPDLIYKDEQDLDGEDDVLENAEDLKRMLQSFPGGQGVRIIVRVNG